MHQFTVNPNRFDPYKDFKFRVMWDNQYVAGVSRVSALRRTTDVVEHREGGGPSSMRKSPGLTTYDAITLERGVTHDRAFEEWAHKVFALGNYPGNEMSLKDFRKDILIDLHNEAGQIVIRYHVFRCWPSEYVALPNLDAETSGVAIERLTLENEGWERDAAVVEPLEQSLNMP